jgi:hypothetical protein
LISGIGLAVCAVGLVLAAVAAILSTLVAMQLRDAAGAAELPTALFAQVVDRMATGDLTGALTLLPQIERHRHQRVRQRVYFIALHSGRHLRW